MIKDLMFKTVAVAVLATLLAAPAFGSVCTMSCGDDSGGCCCSSFSDGTLSYAAESCCSPEYSPDDTRSTLLPDRTSGGVRPGSFTGLAYRSPSTGGGAASHTESPELFSRAASRGRSSPLFVLHSSFLI